MLGPQIMPDLETQLKRTVKSTVIVVACLVVAVALDYHNIIYKGLLLGCLVSLQNAIFLNLRIKRVADIKDVGKAIAYMRRGYFTRLIIIMATLWLSIKIPSISLNATAVGLFVAPIFAISDFFITAIKESASKASTLDNKVSKIQREGGEKA